LNWPLLKWRFRLQLAKKRIKHKFILLELRCKNENGDATRTAMRLAATTDCWSAGYGDGDGCEGRAGWAGGRDDESARIRYITGTLPFVERIHLLLSFGLCPPAVLGRKRNLPSLTGFPILALASASAFVLL